MSAWAHARWVPRWVQSSVNGRAMAYAANTTALKCLRLDRQPRERAPAYAGQTSTPCKLVHGPTS